VGANEPGLVPVDAGERIGQVHLPGPDRLDLGPGQGEAGLDRVVDRELVAGAPVEGDRLLGDGGDTSAGRDSEPGRSG